MAMIIPIKNKAFAGIGNPIKYGFVGDELNLARRMAPPMTIKATAEIVKRPFSGSGEYKA